MKISKRMITVLVGVGYAASVSIVSAHSTVAPSQTTTSKYETFTLSVPVEKTVPTVGIKLLIPAGLDRVTPIVKPGWQVRITKNASSSVTQLEWYGGSIPPEEKDVFGFTARTSPQPVALIWKVYQTYKNGEVVAWDRDPKAFREGETVVENPYSITDVVLDAEEKQAAPQNNSLPLVVSIGAIGISLAALFISIRKSPQV